MNKPKSIFYGKPFGEFLRNLVLITRFYEWADKVWLIFGAGLILMLYLPLSEEVFHLFLIFGLYQCVSLCFGYIVNAYADREIDALVGKDRGASYFSKKMISIMLTFLFLGMLGIPLYFRRLDVILLGLINIFFALFYSLRPIRFKERGFWAIIVSGIPQRSFIFLFFALVVPSDPKLELILFCWLGLLGLLMEIGHQLFDYKNDKKSNVKTWATSTRISTAKKVGTSLFGLFLLTIFVPIFIFQLYSGLMISFILLSFSSHSIYYFIDSLKAV